MGFFRVPLKGSIRGSLRGLGVLLKGALWVSLGFL